MNKQELVEKVAKDTGAPKAQAEKFVSATFDAIHKGLKTDKTVQLVGFGSFNVRSRKARTGRNPRTGEAIKIKASKTVVFKAGKALKSTL